MDKNFFITTLFLLVYFFLTSYVQFLIIISKLYDTKKKLLQSIIIWLIPIVSATLFLFLYKDSKPDTNKRKKINNTGNDPNEYI